MILKIMMIIAEIIMTLRLIKATDKGTTTDVACNGFVLTVLCLIARFYM